MPFRQIPDFLLIVEAAAAAFAVTRLLQFRMGRQFPALVSFLFVSAIRASILSVLPDKSRTYLWVYLALSPVATCVAALSVREMFTLVFRDFPGLRTTGRWGLYVALTLAVFASVLLVGSPPAGATPNSVRLFYEMFFDRSVELTLAVVIVMLMVVLSRYPLHLDRNTYIASSFFSAMFLAQAIVRLIDSLSPRQLARYADYPEVGFTALCFAGWGLMLRGANATVAARQPADERREAELLQQLESLNSILTRSVRG